jgi:hypothetical protein
MQLVHAVLAATLVTVGCRSATAPVPLVGTAVVTIETPTGTQTVQGVEAAFYLYNPGPTSSTRAWYVALGTREKRPGAFSLELFQFLADLQEIPSVGTFAAWEGALGGNPAMSADVHYWGGVELRQYFPATATDSVTIETATADRVTGRFSIKLRDASGSDATVVMAIHGTFTAERAARYEDLPVVR